MKDAPFVFESGEELPAGDENLSRTSREKRDGCCVRRATHMKRPLAVCQNFWTATVRGRI